MGGLPSAWFFGAPFIALSAPFLFRSWRKTKVVVVCDALRVGVYRSSLLKSFFDSSSHPLSSLETNDVNFTFVAVARLRSDFTLAMFRTEAKKGYKG